MRNYCTLFDRNYLTRGLCLHASLIDHKSEDSMLYILAMDVETYNILKMIENKYINRVEILDLRDLLVIPSIDAAFRNRTWQEFCWTMASVMSHRLMLDRKLTNLTYLDADTFFFSDPAPVHDQLLNAGIGITPHRLIPSRKELEVNGKYNVGWVTWKATRVGLACVSEWASACLDWCYNRHEPGRFGDQKYLDLWPHKYSCCVREIQNLGVNAAPWNISQYKVEKRNDGIFIENDKLVLYHFHEFKKKEDGTFYLTGWPLQEEVKELIYKPYIELYQKIDKQLEALCAD